jgi:hypothetical protein
MQRKRPTLALTSLSSAVYRHIVRSKVISKTRYVHQLTAKRTLWLEHTRPSRTTCAITYTLARPVLFPGPMAIAHFGFAAPPHKQPSLSLNRIPFPSLWALTTVPASGSLPILWLSPCPWPWPTPFFLWYAHSSPFSEGACTLSYSVLFCSHSRPRSSASFFFSIVRRWRITTFLPSFLSVGHAHSPGRACCISGVFLLLLPAASLSNLCVRLPAVVRARARVRGYIAIYL